MALTSFMASPEDLTVFVLDPPCAGRAFIMLHCVIYLWFNRCQIRMVNQLVLQQRQALV